MVYRLHLVNQIVKLLWILNYVGIANNESADRLAFSTKFDINHRLFKTPISDLQIYKKLFGVLGNPNGLRHHFIITPGMEVFHWGLLYGQGFVAFRFLGA